MRTTVALDATKLAGAVPSGSLGNVPPSDTSVLEYNQAILAFKIASANQLAKFSMVDQVIDEFQDATGIDAGASTNELAGGSGTAKYYEGGAGSVPTTSSVGSVASAGTVDGDYTYYKWTTVGTTHSFTTNVQQNYDYIVVAGGGGGGGWGGGGGGAGGFLTGTGLSVNGTISNIKVGSGGAGSPSGTYYAAANAAAGLTSVFSTIASAGGGFGGNDWYSSGLGGDGGSGGGAAVNGTGSNQGSGNTPTTSPSQGYDGGAVPTGASTYMGCGGGGAGGAGGNGYSSGGTDRGGLGGVGENNVMGMNDADSDAFLTTISVGHDVGGTRYLAGGGGGGEVFGNTIPPGGSGGGGAGGLGGTVGVDGTANTGGGGGGAGATSSGGTSQTGGGDGGTGIVIIRRLTSAVSLGGDLTLVSTQTTAEAEPTTADLIFLVEDGAGTATINRGTPASSDVRVYIGQSATATPAYVEATDKLYDEGDTNGKRIFKVSGVDISSLSGTKMNYKITTHNQGAGSKETRIHATSLAWA